MLVKAAGGEPALDLTATKLTRKEKRNTTHVPWQGVFSRITHNWAESTPCTCSMSPTKPQQRVTGDSETTTGTTDATIFFRGSTASVFAT